MAKPTFRQRYALGQLWYGRIFGVVFAIFAVGITASNLPWLIREGSVPKIALNLIVGIAFLLIGIAIYRVCNFILRKYRAYIESGID
jgi:hypothetical protein